MCTYVKLIKIGSSDCNSNLRTHVASGSANGRENHEQLSISLFISLLQYN